MFDNSIVVYITLNTIHELNIKHLLFEYYCIIYLIICSISLPLPTHAILLRHLLYNIWATQIHCKFFDVSNYVYMPSGFLGYRVLKCSVILSFFYSAFALVIWYHFELCTDIGVTDHGCLDIVFANITLRMHFLFQLSCRIIQI